MSTLKWMESVNCMLAKELIEQRKDRDIARGERDQMRKERDEALEALKQIEEYGTKEINEAVTLRQELAKALLERDEALEENKKFSEALEWISKRYDDSKPIHQVAMDAYEMSCTAGSVLQKEAK